VFGAGYGAALGVAAAHDFDSANGWLAVPVLGPWISLTKRESPCNIEDVNVKQQAEECVDSALDEASLIAAIAIDGLVQAIGAGLFLAGSFTKNKELVRDDVAGLTVRPRRIGRSGYGLGLRARF